MFIILTLMVLSRLAGLTDGSGNTQGRRESRAEPLCQVSPFARTLPKTHIEVLQIRTWMH